MCNKTTPDAAAAALTTLMHALIDISVIADRAHKHAARESECIFHYLAFVQLKPIRHWIRPEKLSWLMCRRCTMHNLSISDLNSIQFDEKFTGQLLVNVENGRIVRSITCRMVQLPEALKHCWNWRNVRD